MGRRAAGHEKGDSQRKESWLRIEIATAQVGRLALDFLGYLRQAMAQTDDVALALSGASSKTDQAAIDRIVAEHGRDGFLPAWLRHRGVEWAADLIPSLTNLETPS